MDRREQILSRLFDVLKTVPGPVVHVRNRGDLPPDMRPGLTMLDADEQASEKAFNRGRIAAAPNLVVMTPEIYVTLKSQKPSNATTGQDLNTLRAAILKAVLLDRGLQDLVGTNGEIRYDGCITDLARGRDMIGEIGISVSFVYPLNPDEL